MSKVESYIYNEDEVSLTVDDAWEYAWAELTIGAFAQGITTLRHLCKYTPDLSKTILEILEQKYRDGWVNVDKEPENE